MSGCIETFDFLCQFAGENEHHCYQWVAVQSSNPDECAKVQAPSEFASRGSNPPKDKCYLRIAEETGDTSVCDRIEGGFMSYSVEECYVSAARQNANADLCKGSPDEEDCRTRAALAAGGCGTGYKFNEETEKCEKSNEQEEERDPECSDPTFVSKCISSNKVLRCSDDGKKSIENCKYGCFEAECRTEPGPTDIEEEQGTTDKEQESDLEEDEEETECETDDDCIPGEECQNGKCIQLKEGECKSDEDCGLFENCDAGKCKEPECIFPEDCADGKSCEQGKCVEKDECKSGDKACISKTTAVHCEDGKLREVPCEYGCKEGKCIDEPKPECKEGSRCVSEHSLEVCKEGKKQTMICDYGCKEGKCKPKSEKKCTGWQAWNPFCREADDDIEDKVKNDLKTIGDAAAGKYMELLDKEIEKEKDPAKKRGLIAYKSFLNKAGDSMDKVQTTVDTLKSLKRIFLDSYDPSMDIENMPVDKILQKGLFERMSDAIFGGPKTEAGKELAEAEDAITVYEKMLERQAEIDYLKQSRMQRLKQTLAEGAKSEATSQLADKAEGIAQSVAGNAMMTVSIAKYALDSFQEEAKNQMFYGLARAYNRVRTEIEKESPGISPEEAHKRAVAELKENPYLTAKGRTFIKYGNLLENPDCSQNTGNQLCIDSRVFWTAMDKTYRYKHQ